jgi:predicted transcriptional regulator
MFVAKPRCDRLPKGYTPRLLVPTATTSIKLDSDTKERVLRLAASRRRSAHWLLREAVEQYVAREEAAEQLRKDAVSAWEHYSSTGLHATEDETDAWLAKLEAGEDIDPPECHN